MSLTAFNRARREAAKLDKESEKQAAEAVAIEIKNPKPTAKKTKDDSNSATG